jgi:hypothetical protein
VCANFFEEQRSLLPLTDSLFKPDEANKNVHQVAVFAAAAGQRAKNDPVRRTGRFSETALAFLKGDGEEPGSPHAADGRFPPDDELLVRHLEAHFKELRRRGVLAQTPVRFLAEGSACCTILIGEVPTENRLQEAIRRSKLSVQAIRRFATHLLRAQVLRSVAERDGLVEQLPATVRNEVVRVADDAIEDLAGIVGPSCETEEELVSLRDTIEAMNPAKRLHVRAAVERLRVAATLRPWLSGGVLGARDLRRLYVLSSPSPSTAPRVDEADEMLDELQQMPPRHSGAARPVVEFAERVARAIESSNHADAQARAKQVRRWIDDNEPEEKVVETRRALDGERTGLQPLSHLLIDVGDDSRKEMEFWLYCDEPSRCRHGLICKRPAAPSPARDAGVGGSIASGTQACADASADDIKRSIAALVNSIADEEAGELRVEVFVPEAWLCADVDRCPLEPDDSTVTIGRRFPVAVRWRDRALTRRGDRYRSWRRVAGEIRTLKQLSALWLEPNQESPDDIQSQVAPQRVAYACVSFAYVPVAMPAAPSAPLRAALRAGMPYGIWLRQPLASWDTYRRSVDNMMIVSAFDDLPRHLQAIREQARASDPQHPGHHLIVFWDDPTRNPLAEQFQTP